MTCVHSKNASAILSKPQPLEELDEKEPNRGGMRPHRLSLKSDEKFMGTSYFLPKASNIIVGIQLLNVVLCWVLWQKTHVGGLGPRDTENG